MELRIGSDETLDFCAEHIPSDRCLLKVKELTIETETLLAEFAIDLTEGECEKLINVLCGWHARLQAAKKTEWEAGRATT